MKKSDKIYVAGHTGLAGSAIWRHLANAGYTNLVGRSSRELDLKRRDDVISTMKEISPDVVIGAAAKVGGIGANVAQPVDFLSENLQMQVNLLDAAHYADVERLIFLGSSCIYPKMAKQPIQESSLMTGPLEETSSAYGIAKIAGVFQVQAYRKQYRRRWISAMPANLYGPNDNYHPTNSHAFAALIRRFHEAKLAGSSEVKIWGSGKPLREFLHVDDLASAVEFLLQNYDEPEAINIGSGEEVSIKELSHLIAEAVGFQGDVLFDLTKADGTPRKIMDSSKLQALGWNRTWNLRDGVANAYEWFLSNLDSLRSV